MGYDLLVNDLTEMYVTLNKGRMTMDFAQLAAQADTLIEALPYIQRFRGQTFVIKYGGAAMEEPDLIPLVLRDIVFLEAVGINTRHRSWRRKAITRRLKEKGVAAHFVGGLARHRCRDRRGGG